MNGRLTKEKIQICDEHFVSKGEFLERSSEFIGDKLGIASNVMLRGFLAREEEASTAIGLGFAIPHAILKEADESHVFLHLVDNGVEYEAYDDIDVTVVFSLVIAENNYNQEHLRRISSIARSLMDEENQRILKTERNLETLVSLVNGMEENL